MTRCNWVNIFLVCRPDEGPVKVCNILARALSENELPQGRDGHASSSDTTDCREPRVIPAPDNALVNKLSKLALGQKGSDEVHTSKVPDLH